jgi:small-conductance mechanosensitive channel
MNMYLSREKRPLVDIRQWVKTDDYWPVYWDTQREVKHRLGAEEITIPFPQRDIHHHSAEGRKPVL